MNGILVYECLRIE